MNSKNRYICVVLVLLTCWNALSSQSLSDLLQAADSANLELQALEKDYLAALERAPQVSQLPEPEVGLGIFALPVETRLGPQWVRLSATQMFPWKGTRDARKEVMLVMAKAQYEKIAASRLELHYRIKQAWFQLYELEQRRQILRQSIRVFQTIESLATTRIEAGKGNLADVLRIQLRIRELEEERALLENQQTKPRSVINRLLNRTESSPVTIADTLLPAQPPYDREALVNDIRDNHPMLRMYALQQETARQAIRLNELEGKPSFAAGLDYIYVSRRTDAAPTGNGRDIVSPRIGIRLPLYRDKYDAKEQEERLKIQALEIRKQDQLLQFRSALEGAYADLEDARIKLRLYEEQIQTTESVIDLLLTEYSTEGARFLDLLQLENQLIQYELKTLSAVVQTHLAQAEIERYIP